MRESVVLAGREEAPPRAPHLASLLAAVALCLATAGCAMRAPDMSVYRNANERYEVEIRRDDFGVPHIYGKTDPDTAFGLAYAHAEDDFATIQQVLVMTRGQLASVTGRPGAVSDYLVALLGARESVEAHYARDLSPAVRAVVEAYAEGLNYYAATHPDEVGERFHPVRGQDVVTGFVVTSPLFFGLDRELQKLYAGPEGETAAVRTQTSGSNAFAVAPSRSTDGWTRLVANSHQPWHGPVAWYQAHVRSEQGWDAAGGLFPGSPFVLLGHNRHLAWTNTVNRPDLVDVYELDLNPEDPDQYRLDGQWHTLEKHEVRIRVRLWGPFYWTVSREVLRSVHGPVLRLPHGTFAFRYAGMGDIRQVEQYYRLDRAKDLEEFREVMRLQAIPATNFIYADEAGNIGYFYNARFPKRQPGHDWRRHLPGDRSDLIWTRYVSFDRVPQVVNPRSGYVFNTNNTPFHATGPEDNPLPANYPLEWGVEPYMNNRAYRAMELFDTDPRISREELLRYKFDLAYSERDSLRTTVHRVLEADASGDALLADAQAVLRRWDFRTNRENTAAPLGVMLAAPLVKAEFFGTPVPDPVQLIREAAAHLRKHFGRLDVPLGEFQRLVRGNVDLPLDGGPGVLRAIRGTLDAAGRLVANDGDGLILLVEWDPEGRLHAHSVHQFGSATSAPGSTHYSDQSPLFAEMRLRPTWFDERDLEQHLSERYRPGEARP